MPVDYFGAQNRGLQALGEAFDSMSERRRREKEDERRNRLTTLQLETGQEQLEKLRDERRKNREIEADIQGIPTTKKTMISAGGPEETEDWGVTTQETPISPQELAQQRMGVYLKHRRPVEAGQEQNIVAGQQTMEIQQETAQREQRKEIVGRINNAVTQAGGDLNKAKSIMKMQLIVSPIQGLTPDMVDHIVGVSSSDGTVQVRNEKGVTYAVTPDGKTHFNVLDKPTDPKLITTQGPTGPIRSPDVAGAVPYEKTPKETINPYNIYYSSEKVKGQTDEQIAKSWDAKELEKAKASRSYLAIRGIQKTGAYFDATDKKWKINTDEGVKELTSAEVKQMNLAFGEETPTSRVRTMQQLAPKVLDLAHSTRTLIEAEVKNLGPVESRKRSIMADKIGMADPKFTAIETHADLLGTLLANMHVGASGAEKTIERFSDMVKVKNQSPENLLANIDAIIGYAESGKKNKYATEPTLPWGKKGAITGTVKYSANGKNYNIPTGQEMDFLKDHPNAKKVP